MAQITRTMVREPSNSKVPGGTRHLSINDKRFERGIADLPEGHATIKIGGTFSRASGKGERVAVELAVIVTGNHEDTFVGLCGGSRGWEILFTGVRAA